MLSGKSEMVDAEREGAEENLHAKIVALVVERDFSLRL